MNAGWIVALCREGFEPETAADLARAAARAGMRGIPDSAPSRGFVFAECAPLDASRWRSGLRAAPPVFARNPTLALQFALPVAGSASPKPDRVTPLLEAIETLASLPGHAPPWRSVWVEHPDTNDGKTLSRLARSLQTRVESSLGAAGQIDAGAPLRLHILLTGGHHAFVGTSEAAMTPWPLGIPRISRSRRAPSRSALKLSEAFIVFLGDRETALLRAGQRAVDLGAAPGGWSFVLAQRGLRVTAVDNGPLKGEVASDALVTHVREDGLRYRPRRRVDWLTCDIVEQPMRIAETVAGWIADGAARHAIFNLKLPMKKRYDEVRRCEAAMTARFRAAGVNATLAFRQLYHDREEVTGYAGPIL